MVALTSPVLEKAFVLAPTLATSAKLVQVEPAQRSIEKPSSFEEASVHERLIWLDQTVVAARLVGAAGGGGKGVVACATGE